MMGIRTWVGSAATVALLAVASPAAAQLYTQSFDVDDTANWTINVGPTDESADFFFDYNTVGIPSAPNSTGGSTRGMRLAANITDAIFGGFSVSPTGKSFTGDYVLKFDLWQNFIGADPGGVPLGGAGSTQLSTFGILTSGTTSNYAGAADSVFFAVSGDGQSSADFRAYSSERAVSYQWPRVAPPGAGSTEDLHATYHADSRQNTAALYADNFGNATVPAAQTALFPETQHGTTAPGSIGFEWHAVEVAKVGTTVTWKIDGILLVTVETDAFTTPTGGNNILFGHSDVNATLSLDPYYASTQFTLIDNVRVEAAAPPADDADFDGDGDVDGADFLTWQKGLGLSGGAATNAAGNANNDTVIDDDDLGVWKNLHPPSTAAVSAVPEPATWALAALAALACVLAATPRRRLATAVVEADQR